MYVIASYEQSLFVELAISALEQHGVHKDQILAIPLDKRSNERPLFDTLHRADGYSLFDIGAILGTCGMLLGAIYGMVLAWGPILWGLMGLVSGFLIGFLIKLIAIQAKQHHRRKSTLMTEVVLLIQCTKDQSDWVTNCLWDNLALGVAKLEINSRSENA